MFSQLFGKYLVEKQIITLDEYRASIEKQLSVRVKLGTIAITEGLLSEADVDMINKLQMQFDKRFGDIAQEKGLLTDAQIGELLQKQGNPYMKFIQVLEEVSGIEQSKIEVYVEAFRKSIGFTLEELDALKNEDIDKIVPIFAYASNSNVTRIAALALRNITR